MSLCDGKLADELISAYVMQYLLWRGRKWIFAV